MNEDLRIALKTIFLVVLILLFLYYLSTFAFKGKKRSTVGRTSTILDLDGEDLRQTLSFLAMDT